MKTAVVLLFLAGTAHADSQWYECVAFVEAPDLGIMGNSHYDNSECAGSERKAMKLFITWLAKRLAKEEQLGIKHKVADVACAPTHQACVE
jgi:hypothetical protein